MGTMTESAQMLAIERLSEYRQRIEELIEEGASFLITGNALEVFGKRIEDVDGTVIDGLGLVDITTKRNMMNRFNSLYLGTFFEDETNGVMSGESELVSAASRKRSGDEDSRLQESVYPFLLGKRSESVSAVHDGKGAGTGFRI